MSEKKKSEGEFKVDPNAWMMTFSDLVMLLLTFFVLLLTMSSMDSKALKQMFIQFTGAAGVLELSGAGDIEAFSEFMDRIQDSDKVVVVDSQMMEDIFFPKSETGNELSNVIREIENLVNVADDHRGLVLSFQNDILFDAGSAVLQKRSHPVLDRIAGAIASSPNDILIVGHTDDTPIRNRAFASNWELSVQRGLAVLEYILRTSGLPKARFAVGGYGASQPAYPNDTPESRTMNRRVEIIFKHLSA